MAYGQDELGQRVYIEASLCNLSFFLEMTNCQDVIRESSWRNKAMDNIVTVNNPVNVVQLEGCATSSGFCGMPPTQCHTRMEGQRRKILSRYCEVLQCFLSPERFLAFSSVAKVPLQALNELRHRAPLPQLAMDLGFLQQLGVVGKTVKLDLQARYYVDLHSCKNALQERVSKIMYLIESKPEHLKWAWQDATV